jgi:hypothetical protein
LISIIPKPAFLEKKATLKLFLYSAKSRVARPQILKTQTDYSLIRIKGRTSCVLLT